MKDLTQSRAASVLTVLLGGWLALSPIWISLTGAALVSLFIVAGLMIFFGLVQLFTDNSLPSWIVGITAVWLFVSTFVYSISNTAAWNEAISAVVAFILATWDAAETMQVHDRRHGVAA